MLLWLGFAVVSAAVLVALLHPLLRQGGGGSAEADAAQRDIAIYKDQLAEVDAERDRGQLGDVEAEAARAEIGRRLIAAEDRVASVERSRTVLPAETSKRFAVATVVLLLLIAGGLYLRIGSPSLPDQPLSARNTKPADPGDIGRMIAAVERRLKEHPEEGQGWDVIAPVYLRMGRYAEAADAFQRAIRLLGESSKRLAGFAESTVLASDGIVTEPARLAYEKLIKLEPQRPEPRFWLALAKEQDGKLEAALSDYRALLRDGDPKANWRTLVEERVAEVEQRLGRGAPADAKPKPKETEAPLAAGPRAEDVKAAERLSEAERRQMIEGMVQSLAERLAKDGRDLAGWERLIRAYSVMGRKDDALAALSKARGHFTGEQPSLNALSELARALGLES